MRRSTTSPLLAAVVLVALSGAALAAPSTVSDPLGDVTSSADGSTVDDASIDLTSFTSELTGQLFRAEATTAAPEQTGDQLFVTIDTDGVGQPEYLLTRGELSVPGEARPDGGFNWVSTACPVTSSAAGSTISLSIASSCLSSPAAATARVQKSRQFVFDGSSRPLQWSDSASSGPLTWEPVVVVDPPKADKDKKDKKLKKEKGSTVGLRHSL